MENDVAKYQSVLKPMGEQAREQLHKLRPRKHILLLDPDAENLKLHTECLHYANYSVSGVQTGFEAIKILLPEIRMFPQLRNRLDKHFGGYAEQVSKPVYSLQAARLKSQNSQIPCSPERPDLIVPDLIVIDLRLPDISGLSLTRFLKETPATRQIPILIFTALTHKHHQSQSFEAGCSRFLGKPTSIKIFLSTVDQLFEKGHKTLPAKINTQIQPMTTTVAESLKTQHDYWGFAS